MLRNRSHHHPFGLVRGVEWFAMHSIDYSEQRSHCGKRIEMMSVAMTDIQDKTTSLLRLVCEADLAWVLLWATDNAKA